MPNLAYNRSVRREREVVNDLRRRGWTACRSAGSKSEFDVWAYHPGYRLLKLIQIKTQRGGRALTVTRKWETEGVVAAHDWYSYEPSRKAPKNKKDSKAQV